MDFSILKLATKILRIFSVVIILIQLFFAKFVQSILPLPSGPVFVISALIISHIILIILNTILIKKINEDSEYSLYIGILNSIIGSVVGKIFATKFLFAIYVGLLVYLILLFISEKFGIESNMLIKIVPIAVIAIVLITSRSTSKNASVQTDSQIIKDFEKIEKNNTIEEIEEKLGKDSKFSEDEETENQYAVFEYEDEDLSIKVTLKDNETYSKEISFFSSDSNKLFGNKKITFKNFDKLISSFENKTLTYEELKSTLGNQDGIEYDTFYGFSNTRSKYIFADTQENYISVTFEGNTFSGLSGTVDGKDYWY